ncbi:MAG: hypothetical protein NT178_12975 [Proteobacteria bacterium]|nr:hypothetical protein [Pseudomonadota bacterium]
MKIEFTDKGMTLIILMGIIVAVGIIGAGIVSFMDVKQRSYPVAVKTYQALNLANAGVEFAIRYKTENPGAFLNPANPLSPGNAITINFGEGRFTVQYLGNPPTSNYALKSTGECGVGKREVRIEKFAGYSQGSGLVITPIVDATCQQPVQGCLDANCNTISCPGGELASRSVSIPMTNLFDNSIYIKYIELNRDGGSTSNRLRNIYLGGILGYSYTSDGTNPNLSGSGVDRGICIPTFSGAGCTGLSSAKVPYGYDWGFQVQPGALTDILNFNSNSIPGQYKLKIYFDFDTNYLNLQSVTINFTI